MSEFGTFGMSSCDSCGAENRLLTFVSERGFICTECQGEQIPMVKLTIQYGEDVVSEEKMKEICRRIQALIQDGTKVKLCDFDLRAYSSVMGLKPDNKDPSWTPIS